MKMKRNLIAVAAAGLASAVIVTPAMADATAYGLVQVEVASYSNQKEAAGCNDQSTASDTSNDQGTACDGLSVIDRANGRVGVKASEDLGNGWTGLAKAEFQLDTANGGLVISGSQPGGARETFVGLKSSDVEVQLGNLKSAYKYTGGVKYDPFVATTLEARRDNGGMWHTKYGAGGFMAKSVGVMGKAGPIKYWLTYGPGEGNHDMTASVMYSQDAFEVFVAMSDQGDYSATADSATKIGGAFKTGPHKIKLQYEMVDRDLTPSRDETYMFVGYELKMGNNTFVAQFGQYDGDGLTNAAMNYTANDPANDTKKVDTQYLAIGVIHNFTKTTRLFAGYRSSDADDDTEEDVISVGLRKDF